MEHADYPHTPGALPGCPACDLELARQAYAEIRRGTGRCYGEVMELLDKPHKRLVEIAVTAEQVAAEEDIPVRDALHKLGFGDKTKAQVAEWICPDAASDWTGSFDERRAAQDANQDRARERMNDQVLANAAGLAQDDRSEGAEHLREVAASVRDHREMAHRRAAWALQDEEEALLDKARALYIERDLFRVKAEAFQEEEDWHNASIAALDMSRKDDEADQLVHRSINVGNAAKDELRQADQYADANRRAGTR